MNLVEYSIKFFILIEQIELYLIKVINLIDIFDIDSIQTLSFQIVYVSVYFLLKISKIYQNLDHKGNNSPLKSYPIRFQSYSYICRVCYWLYSLRYQQYGEYFFLFFCVSYEKILRYITVKITGKKSYSSIYLQNILADNQVKSNEKNNKKFCLRFVFCFVTLHCKKFL